MLIPIGEQADVQIQLNWWSDRMHGTGKSFSCHDLWSSRPIDWNLRIIPDRFHPHRALFCSNIRKCSAILCASSITQSAKLLNRIYSWTALGWCKLDSKSGWYGSRSGIEFGIAFAGDMGNSYCFVYYSESILLWRVLDDSGRNRWMARPISEMSARSEPELFWPRLFISDNDRRFKAFQQVLSRVRCSRICAIRARLDARPCVVSKCSRKLFRGKLSHKSLYWAFFSKNWSITVISRSMNDWNTEFMHGAMN
jgi:hypothetical protein